MGEHRRKADDRRVFSTEFKRQAVQRILTGEKTIAELAQPASGPRWRSIGNSKLL